MDNEEERKKRGPVDAINSARNFSRNLRGSFKAVRFVATNVVRAAAGASGGWTIFIVLFIIFIIIWLLFFSEGSAVDISTEGNQSTGSQGGTGSTGGNTNPSSSDINCYTSMSGADMDAYFASQGYIYFNNTGGALATLAEKHKINPALIIAIGRMESQLGNAYQSDPDKLAKKNAFGIGGADNLQPFSTWEEGAEVSYKSVASYGCATLECIQQIYAPVGSSDDPGDLNSNWLTGVKAILSEIPHASCQPPAGTISDWPIQKPIASCSVTQRPGEGFSHPNLNAVDLGLLHGTKVYSTNNGPLTELYVYAYNCYPTCSSSDGKGTYVKVSNGYSWAIYAHLIPESVSHLSLNQTINKSDYLGQVDNTGYSDGAHLHYELSSDQTFPDFDTACN